MSILPTKPALRIGLLCIFLLALVELSVIIWTAYDHSIPCWDTAAHRLNSIAVYELLQHPHLGRIHWYRDIFSIGQLYPPFYYMVSAALKFACSAMADTELLSNMIFIAILFFSLYYMAQVICQDKLFACAAAILVFLYPGVYWSTHCALLDCAANSMVALGLACLIWWTKSPCLSRSIVFGLVLGLNFLTKNNTPIFFIGPLLVDTVLALRKPEHGERDYDRIKQLSIVGLVSIMTILPWLVLSGPTLIKAVEAVQKQNFPLNAYLVSNQPADSIQYASNRFAEFFIHLRWFTLIDLPLILSPLLYGCFLTALVIERPYGRNKLYLIASALGSIVLASAFRWPHQFRYIVPAAAPIAILTVSMFARLWFTRRFVWRAALLAILGIALMQFVYDGFSPYPVHLPGWVSKVMKIVAEDFKTDKQDHNVQGVSRYPWPEQDWGVIWVLSNVERESGGKPTSLLVLPSSESVNCSFYCYMTRARRDGIEIGTLRQLTELGDQVCFEPQKAIYYQWCVLKTNDQGRQFYDANSKADYDRWCQFIRARKAYDLFATKLLPDGSIMQLYRRKELSG